MRNSVLLSLAVIVMAAGTVAPISPVLGEEATTAPAISPAVIDVKNTKCIVAKDDVGDSKLTVTYLGKLYHLCCADCKKEFAADPEKYVKALEKDPATYGITK